MPLRPTLRDIARKTGFSTSTVSAALNNDPRVRAETRAMVRAAADRIGYIPDPALLALSAHRWDGRRNLAGMTIAYLSDKQTGEPETNPHAVMIEAMKRRAEGLGYRFYIHRLRELGTAERANRILASRNTSGLIVGPIRDESLLAGFDWRPFSAIAVDLGHYRPPLPLVTHNPLTCVQVAWRNILASGRHRIGMVLAPDTKSDFFNEQRASVLRLQNELPRGVRRIPLHDYTGMTALAAWVERHRPEVIISYHEWLISGLQHLGLRVPEDIAFVSISKHFKAYPDVPLHPEITGTVAHPDRLGRMAVDQVDLLIRRNEKGAAPFNFTIYIDLSWHPGSTLPATHQKSPPVPGTRAA